MNIRNTYMLFIRRNLIYLLQATAFCCLLLNTFSMQSLGGELNDNLELQVKVAYIYNFTKFVYWAPSTGNNKSGVVTICVFGTDPIGETLEDFAKTQTAGRTLIVKRIKKKVSEIPACNMLFISPTEQKQLPSILRQIEGGNVLTVSDIPGFVRRGGMIGFYIDHDRVKIEINLKAANNAGLKISAKLLEVARIVSNEN